MKARGHITITNLNDNVGFVIIVSEPSLIRDGNGALYGIQDGTLIGGLDKFFGLTGAFLSTGSLNSSKIITIKGKTQKNLTQVSLPNGYWIEAYQMNIKGSFIGKHWSNKLDDDNSTLSISKDDISVDTVNIIIEIHDQSNNVVYNSSIPISLSGADSITYKLSVSPNSFNRSTNQAVEVSLRVIMSFGGTPTELVVSALPKNMAVVMYNGTPETGFPAKKKLNEYDNFWNYDHPFNNLTLTKDSKLPVYFYLCKVNENNDSSENCSVLEWISEPASVTYTENGEPGTNGVSIKAKGRADYLIINTNKTIKQAAQDKAKTLQITLNDGIIALIEDHSVKPSRAVSITYNQNSWGEPNILQENDYFVIDNPKSDNYCHGFVVYHDDVTADMKFQDMGKIAAADGNDAYSFNFSNNILSEQIQKYDITKTSINDVPVIIEQQTLSITVFKGYTVHRDYTISKVYNINGCTAVISNDNKNIVIGASVNEQNSKGSFSVDFLVDNTTISVQVDVYINRLGKIYQKIIGDTWNSLATSESPWYSIENGKLLATTSKSFIQQNINTITSEIKSKKQFALSSDYETLSTNINQLSDSIQLLAIDTSVSNYIQDGQFQNTSSFWEIKDVSNNANFIDNGKIKYLFVRSGDCTLCGKLKYNFRKDTPVTIKIKYNGQADYYIKGPNYTTNAFESLARVYEITLYEINLHKWDEDESSFDFYLELKHCYMFELYSIEISDAKATYSELKIENNNIKAMIYQDLNEVGIDISGENKSISFFGDQFTWYDSSDKKNKILYLDKDQACFSGKINSNSGQIGGFNINEDSIGIGNLLDSNWDVMKGNEPIIGALFNMTGIYFRKDLFATENGDLRQYAHTYIKPGNIEIYNMGSYSQAFEINGRIKIVDEYGPWIQNEDKTINDIPDRAIYNTTLRGNTIIEGTLSNVRQPVRVIQEKDIIKNVVRIGRSPMEDPTDHFTSTKDSGAFYICPMSCNIMLPGYHAQSGLYYVFKALAPTTIIIDEEHDPQAIILTQDNRKVQTLAISDGVPRKFIYHDHTWYEFSYKH